MRPRTFTDDELLAAARKLFVELGPQVSTARIAKELGVSQAALFKRFSTKEELLLRALMPAEGPEWIALLERGPDERPVPEQLTAILTAISLYFSRLMPAISVIRASGIPESTLLKYFKGEPPPVRAHRAFTTFFRKLDEQGRVRTPYPASVASAMLGAIHGPHHLHHLLRERAPDPGPDYHQRLVELIWEGIQP